MITVGTVARLASSTGRNQARDRLSGARHNAIHSLRREPFDNLDICCSRSSSRNGPLPDNFNLCALRSQFSCGFVTACMNTFPKLMSCALGNYSDG